MRRELVNRNVLVTGGAGFIGSHLVDKIIESGVNKVVILDNLFLGNPDNLKSALEKDSIFIKDDAEIYSTLEYIIENYKIDVVFNCATKALNYSFINPSNAYMMNVNIMNNLLELQRKGKFKTLCHFSTSEVYGTAVYEPMDEKHPFHPTTSYAAGKAAADLMLHSYVNMFGVDAFIVRPFNNYGPRQNYKGNLAGIIPITINRIINGITPEIHGSGDQKRDFIYVEDTVDAVLNLYYCLDSGESVNISSHSMISMNNVIKEIAEIMGYTGQILYKERRCADVECHNASNNKMQELIDFTPISFVDGLRTTVEWYLKEINNDRK